MHQSLPVIVLSPPNYRLRLAYESNLGQHLFLSPPSQKPTEAAPQRDLTDTWQQVLQNLNLPSRALLKEHGQLLYWQGREVRVGIRKTLLRLAQGKVTELEETFEKCFNLKVKVTLKVLTEEQIRTQPQVSVSFKSNAPVTSPKPPSTPPPHNRESPVVAPPPAER
ncbi:hypothetical protein HRE53_09070 [Acaryochloris sp. 'Moss Beach']|uniref:hypothetical protein n=1 Tax=Acaryochloris sp. 'Moss Beach' TaxID=2740837 RepID=UPI001F1967EA|nr:hypothetical protein [Acaryochloris sp. 'Moss Beach']UJB71126.1 hypothetical protein HRE53_09070 [Acaryochloris sp. 'Moss Beach']